MTRFLLVLLIAGILTACGGGGGGGAEIGSGAGTSTGDASMSADESGQPASTAVTWEDSTWQKTNGVKALVWQ
jgi:hypothetical protein